MELEKLTEEQIIDSMKNYLPKVYAFQKKLMKAKDIKTILTILKNHFDKHSNIENAITILLLLTLQASLIDSIAFPDDINTLEH